MEILWTGMGSLLRGDPKLQGYSYLWMFPIYGLALFLEPVHEKIRGFPWYIRGILWAVVIFGIEFITGLLIKLAVGSIPWDYTGESPYQVYGLIRLDYAPAWFTAGILYEKLHDFLLTRVKD